MSFLLIAAIGQTIFKLLLSVMAVFLILLVLVQRGRGGGLAGALGGMGGSSAFGAKAGDVFTRITIIAAAIWILLCIAATKMSPSSTESRINTGLTGLPTAPTDSVPPTSNPATEETASDEAPAAPAGQETGDEGPVLGGDSAPTEDNAAAGDGAPSSEDQ